MTTLQPSTPLEIAPPPSALQRFQLGMKGTRLVLHVITTFFLALGAVALMIPLLYMISMAFKSPAQIRTDPLNPIPMSALTVEIDGRNAPMHRVTVDGVERELALVRRAPGGNAQFVDPANPEEVLLLPLADAEPIRFFDPRLTNFQEAFTLVPFDRYLINTLIVTFGGMTGMLISCTLVAYGFSRFRAPWLNVLFLVLLSTIMLPRQVTIIPTYLLYNALGWVDTLLPLIVPAFFANAYDVFLLRQFFMRIPLDLDDAAKIDGANSFQTLLYVILPQARPALISVAIFHFLYAWNDFYEPMIFLHTPQNWTMAIGLQSFNALYSVNTHLVMAASLVMIIPPILLFFFAQRFFMQGIVITGVKG
jgi:multiple sugar transport system permease protein